MLEEECLQVAVPDKTILSSLTIEYEKFLNLNNELELLINNLNAKIVFAEPIKDKEKLNSWLIPCLDSVLWWISYQNDRFWELLDRLSRINNML